MIDFQYSYKMDAALCALSCVDKNRINEKPDLLFEVNLDLNIWQELGKLKLIE